MRRKVRVFAVVLALIMILGCVSGVSAYTLSKYQVTNLKSGDVFYATYPAATVSGKVTFKDWEGAGAYCTATVKVYNTKSGKLVKTLYVNTGNSAVNDDIFNKTVITKQKYKFVVSNVKSHNGARLGAISHSTKNIVLSR